MIKFKLTLRNIIFAYAATAILASGPALSDMAKNVNHAVSFFQNAKATGGAPYTVDAKGPVAISDKVELPGFAFHVYDLDFTFDKGAILVAIGDGTDLTKITESGGSLTVNF